jgi:ATP:corrinoid adenosyltransferase
VSNALGLAARALDAGINQHIVQGLVDVSSA